MDATTSAAACLQRTQALKRANDVRTARAELKRRVADGTIGAADVILSRSPEFESMAVGELLMCQRRWGEARALRLLSSVPLPESKTIGSLTQRQRDVLIAMLASPEPAELLPLSDAD